MNKAIPEEIQFLLNDVLQIGVLSHADAFSHKKADEFLSSLNPGFEFSKNVLAPLNREPNKSEFNIKDQRQMISPSFKKAWQQFIEAGLLKAFVPNNYQGDGIPECATAPILSQFFLDNPSFFAYLSLTLETAKLIDQYGTEEQRKAYCQPLFEGKWTGTICFFEHGSHLAWENIQTNAREEDDCYKIQGTKNFVAAARHDLTENIIYLVPARVITKDNKPGEMALFIVPEKQANQSNSAENDIQVINHHFNSSMSETAMVTLQFGSKNNCKGYLIPGVGQGIANVVNSFSGVRAMNTLQATAITDSIYQSVIEESKKKNPPDLIKTDQLQTPGAYYPHVAKALIWFQAQSEGLKGVAFSTAFYKDCALHGGKEQKEFFADLLSLYTSVFKVHASTIAFDALKKGYQVAGSGGTAKDSFLERTHLDLVSNQFFSGANDLIELELLEYTLKKGDGRILRTLLSHFEFIDIKLVKSEIMVESIRVWHDYIGGLIVLLDDLKKNREIKTIHEKRDPRQSVMFAGEILRLFGDVIICYHLIRQGIEAERKLEAMGVNFFNIQQEAQKNPGMKKWYNKLVAAQYFALNVLSQHEGPIRIIQRNSTAALDAQYD